jgi:hypothetical protein
MPPKKEAKAEADKPAKAPEFEPSDFGVGPDDPSYQKQAFGTPKQINGLDNPIDDRMKSLLKDHQAMGVR